MVQADPQVDEDQEHNMKIVFVGDTAVGKTSVIMTWTQEVFPSLYEPTVFDTYNGTKNYKGSEIKLQIWDTAGHDDLGRLRPIAYSNTDCFIICFSLMHKNSLENACQKWVAEVKTTATLCPCILVGTKLDLREELERSGDEARLRECVTNAEIEAAAKKYAFQGFVVCSAKEKKGLNKVFHTAFKVVFQMKNMSKRTDSKTSGGSGFSYTQRGQQKAGKMGKNGQVRKRRCC